jgi:hypothetical protein
MDDLTDLQSRVAAAQERLQQSAEEERRYGLRLNDIVSIVEGSLARQRDEVEKLKGEVLDLRTALGKISGERDEAKGALIQAHTALSTAQARLGQREMQNEQLRRMLMELLAAVEGRKQNAVNEVVRRLEGGIQSLIKQEHAQDQELAAPDAGAPRASSAPVMARGRLTVVAAVGKANETTGQLALAQQQAAEEPQVAQALQEDADSEPETVSDIAMREAGNVVTEPDAASPEEQALVKALLDAERKLIEAEAQGGAANANSPVAEIIRRISQRTREINEQAPQG